jgi:hypothetical protein
VEPEFLGGQETEFLVMPLAFHGGEHRILRRLRQDKNLGHGMDYIFGAVQAWKGGTDKCTTPKIKIPKPYFPDFVATMVL